MAEIPTASNMARTANLELASAPSTQPSFPPTDSLSGVSQNSNTFSPPNNAPEASIPTATEALHQPSTSSHNWHTHNNSTHRSYNQAQEPQQPRLQYQDTPAHNFLRIPFKHRKIPSEVQTTSGNVIQSLNNLDQPLENNSKTRHSWHPDSIRQQRFSDPYQSLPADRYISQPTKYQEQQYQQHQPSPPRQQQQQQTPSSSSSQMAATAATSVPSNYPTSSEEWKERGAASIIKTETDENGKVSTRILKKGVQDFEFGRTLGIGSYSTVVGATDKQTQRNYAIKILDKRHIIKEKKVKYVDIEKNTLNRLGDHPGIVRLYYTFQDESSLYFVLDFAANGELLSLIKRMGSLDEICTQYYGSQLLDAVEFMHSRGVIHRDLKPENVLLDDKMRIKVTDFGTAKLLAHEVDQNGKKLISFPRDYRASSFVGTAEYVSPELLVEKAQGKGCDIWAFGCILYQLIAGRPPFKASNEYQTFQKIVKLQYSFPPGFPLSVRDLVKHILVLDPNQRYSISRIKAHPFFEGVNWSRNAIWKQKHPRILPYRPSSRSTSNPISKIASGFPRHQEQPAYASSSSNLIRTNPPAPVNPRSASTSNLITTDAPGPSSSAPIPGNSTTTSSHHGSSTGPSNGRTSTSAAAAALAKPPSSISPYYTPTQQQQQIPAPRPIQSQIREQQAYTASRQQPPQPRAVQTRPKINSNTQQSLPSPSSAQSKSPKIGHPNDTNSNFNGGFGDNSVKPMELPPPSSIDADYAGLLQGSNERILRFGHVSMITSNGGNSVDHEKEPSRISKLFSNRKKKRMLMVTTNGRMIVIGSNDNKVRVELPIANSQVVVKELPFNKKTNTGAFSVDTRNKVYTFEDPNGSSNWISAIDKAKEYVANSESVAASKSYNTAAAAALAAANATFVPNRQVTSSSRRSTDLDGASRGNNTQMPQNTRIAR